MRKEICYHKSENCTVSCLKLLPVGFSCLEFPFSKLLHSEPSSTLNRWWNTEWFQALCLINLHLSFFIQIGALWFVRDQLWLSGSSTEVQPLPSERAEPELEQAAGFRSEASVWFPGESRMWTWNSEVSQHVLVVLRWIWCESCADTKLQTSGWYYTDPHWGSSW